MTDVHKRSWGVLLACSLAGCGPSAQTAGSSVVVDAATVDGAAGAVDSGGAGGTDASAPDAATAGPLDRCKAVLDSVNAAGFGDPARVFQALGFEGFLLQRLG